MSCPRALALRLPAFGLDPGPSCEWTLTPTDREIIRVYPDPFSPPGTAGDYDLAVAHGRRAANPLVGRDRELSVLRVAIDDAMRGACRVVLLEGEAGIGKSRLLEEVIGEAEDRGFRVFRGSAEELQFTGPLGAIVRALGAALVQAPSRGREPDPLEPGVEQPQQDFVEEFIALLAGEALHRPVLFAVEDLHWADPSTVAAAGALIRRLTDLPVLVLLTLRPAPGGRHLNSLLERLSRSDSTRLTLAPLGEESVAALVRSVLGAAPGSKLRAQAARAGGNPLWVLELVKALADADTLDIDDQEAELRCAELPASLRHTILQRLSFLSTETLDVLRVAAVLGSNFDPADLAVCLGWTVVEVVPLLAEASRAGIVGEVGGRLAFRHDLV